MTQRRFLPRWPAARSWPYLAVVSLSLVAAMLIGTPDIAAAQAARRHKPWVPPGSVSASVPGRGAPKVAAKADPDVGAPPLATPSYPSAQTVTVTVPAIGTAAPAKLGGLPVTVAAPDGAPPAAGAAGAGNASAAPAKAAAVPAKVTARSLDHATAAKLGAGTAMALVLSRADGQQAAGPVRVVIDYSSFAQAYGGNYAERLRLVTLPASCASTPTGLACTDGTPVAAVNNPTATTMSATVDATPGGTMIALDSGASGETGDYRATDLNVSQSWTVGEASGDFTYSYPIDLPDPPYGDAPDLSLSYDSGMVDGRTSRSNNQASFVGLGWDINVPYIERQYRPCAEDGYPSWGDLCWSSPYSGDPAAASYVMSINGHTSELIKAADGSYRMKDDLSYRIEHHTGGPNGDNDGEFWEVSTLDGTQYFFGYGQDQRRSTATPTNSNWTVPVVSDDSGEPCHQSNLASCQQTYRWNVDEVHSPNETYQVYFYNTETNSYKRTSSGNILNYIRGGYLAKVEYGKVWAADAPAPAYVTFQNYNRCTQRVAVADPDATPEPTCPTQADSPKSYPDVPTELLCSSSCSKHSPTFFISDMLDSIHAYVQNTSGGYDEVTKWQLKHSYPATSDGTNSSLWLDFVRETGYVGGTIRDAVTSFDGTNYDNRVDWNKSIGVLPLSMRRLTAIHNSYGGETDIVYGHAKDHGCFTAGSAASGWDAWYSKKEGHWDTNTDECYPQLFKPDGADAGWGIFHKYVVTSVTDIDHVGGQPDRLTSYSYLGGAGWHHDDQMLAKDDEKSYGDWRGYGQVQVTEGSGANTEKTVSETTYFRGMSKNVKTDGTTPTVNLTDFDNHAVEDSSFLQGYELQEQNYRMNADGSYTELSGERWTYGTPTRTADGPGAHDAYLVRQATHVSRDLLDGGTYRTSEIDDTYDSYGLVATETDKGDLGSSADDKCTTTTYARNTSDWRWMIDYPETKETRQGSCTGAVIDRTVTLYDGATSTDDTVNAPIDGNPTEVRSYVNDSTYSAVDKTYDEEGRVLTETDPLKHTTTTTYDPATGYPTNGVTVTNALGQATTTWTSPAFGEKIKERDPNGKVTETDYDALGRVTAVWLPSEPRGGGTPSYSYSYATPVTGVAAPTGPTLVTTRQLQSGSGSGAVWLTSYEYEDGFAEPVETQTPSPQTGGREVTVTRYDSRGLEALSSDAFYNSAAPGSGLLNPAESAIPVYTTTSYDSLEQKSAEVTKSLGAELWRTTITDHGDHTVTVPPTGGQVVTWTDVFDKTTKEQDYLDATNHQDTTYTYTATHDDLASVTDPNGNVAAYTYDWLGHRLTETDPDSGPTTTTYDLAGNVVAVTDGKGAKVSTGYDALNRETSTWLGDLNTGTELTSHTYDTVAGAIGQLASSTSYSGGQQYTTTITDYDARYQVTGKTYTIPALEEGLGSDPSKPYHFSYTYDGAGHRTSVSYPAVGGLPAETVTENFTNLGLPAALASPLATYVTATSFTGDGKLAGRQYGSTVIRGYTYEANTNRLATIQTQVSGATVQNDRYGYDANDNVTSISDQVANQNQCYGYDGRRRLVAAYTNTSDCGHAADTGGPAPYNLTYTYDGAGNIKSSSSNGVTTTYTYPNQGPGSVRPHAVSAVGTNSYTYDADGELATATVGGTPSTLTWTADNQLASSTSGGKTTSYVYDADGERLIRRDPGASTLFLDDTELTSAGGAAATATRYYTTGSDGATVAERTAAGLTWLTADGQGSEQLAIGSTGSVSRQRYLPYGAPRGTANQIPGDRGFLGKVQDVSTGLDLLGTRYYDPATGRFVSPDPMDNNDQPDTANPYAYAADNPATFTDPTGLRPADCNASCMRKWEKGQYKAYMRRISKHHSSHSSHSSSSSRKRRTVRHQSCGTGWMCNPNIAEEVAQKSNWFKACFWGPQANLNLCAAPKQPAPKPHKHWSWNPVKHWRGLAKIGVWTAATIGAGVCVAATAGICAGALVSGAVAVGLGAGAGAANYALSAGKHNTRGWIENTAVGAASAYGGGRVGSAIFRAKAGLRWKGTASQIFTRVFTKARYWK